VIALEGEDARPCALTAHPGGHGAKRYWETVGILLDRVTAGPVGSPAAPPIGELRSELRVRRAPLHR